MAFTDNVPSVNDLTLLVGDVALALQGGDATFTWEDVDVDWEDGQTLTARIVRDWTSAVVALNSPATGLPTISGTAQAGETLTADVSGVNDEDGLNNVSYSYQWVSNDGTTDTDIQDATDSTYTLADSDAGKTIKVRVSFTDDADHEETLTSAATGVVAAKPNSPATGAPTISGTAQAGETLTADVSGVNDEDGLNNVSYSYQWVSNDGTTDTDIQDATDSTYTLADSDAGKTIKVRVSFTDDADHEETLTSAATGAVAAKPNSPATGAPTIGGTAQVGETLTADTSGIADADGLTNVSYSYLWIRNDGTTDTDIEDATDSAYTPPVNDVGKTIKVRVSFTDDADNEETLTSGATVEVAAAPNRDATGAPTISGTPQVGKTLTADVSSIADSDGLTNVSYSYQWTAEGSDIDGATGSSYTLKDMQKGQTIQVRVSFTDDADHEETLNSAATGVVAAKPNSPATGLPTIGGTPQVGQTLTADVSGVNDEDGLTSVFYSYQWVANDGTTDTDIQDATDSTYTLVAADVGKTIKVRVSFTDDADHEETLNSAATGVVAAKPNSPATGAPTISGTPQVKETLTAGTSGISDDDGLTDVSYSYRWIAGGSDIAGATGSTYTLVAADAGKTIKVRVSFTDDANNEETLTSAATVVGLPLTVRLVFPVAGHHGASNVFTFDIRLSEEIPLSYKTLKFHAFDVTGGTILRSQRMNKPSNIKWRIMVRPDSSEDVTIVLPATTDCEAQGAICTEDGRMLSNSLVFTVSGSSG